MQAVAVIAEAQNHHPRWANEWNEVRIWLSTHSTKGVTDKDRKLAEAIDNTYEVHKMTKTDDKKTTKITMS